MGSVGRARPRLGAALILALVLVLAALAFYGPGVAGGRRLFFSHDLTGSDIWNLHYPLKAYYAARLRAGALPWWCPEIGTGFPLLAEGQVGALYPPNLILFSALPLPLAFNLGILLHVGLAGLFTAALARELGATRGGALISGLVFAFSGFLVTHLKHTNMVAAAVWAPAVLLLLERQARAPSRATPPLLALAVMATALAGHPQILYYVLLLGAAWGLGLGLGRWRRAGIAAAMRLAVPLVLAAVSGLLLAAPQLLPTLLLSRLGDRRDGISFAEATRYDYHPKLLLTLVRPRAFGDPGELVQVPWTDPRTGRTLTRLKGFEAPPEGSGTAFWETAGYVGLLPIGLAGAAVALGGRRRGVRALLGLAAVSLLLTLGKYGGLLHLLYRVLPGFRLFRLHTRFLLLFDLALALLAGLGFSRIAERLGPRPRLVATLAAAAGAVCLADLHNALGDHNPTIAAESWTRPPRSVEVIRAAEARQLPPARILPLDWEKLVFGNAYYRAGGWKGSLLAYDPAREMLYPDYNLLFGVPSLDFYHPVYPLRMMQAYLATLEFADQGGSRRAVAVNPRLASLYNVGYLITPFWTLEESFPRFVAVASDRVQPAIGPAGPPLQVRLHRNPDVLPRAFLVPRARIVVAGEAGAGTAETSPAPAEALRTLVAPSFDPRRELVLDRGPADPLPDAGEPGEPIAAPVAFLAYQPERVEIEVEAPRSCWLFLSDTYFPGWTAAVDGQPAPIFPANVSGRAVPLGPGKHRVVFRYRQPGLTLGFALALAGAALAGALAVFASPTLSTLASGRLYS